MKIFAEADLSDHLEARLSCARSDIRNESGNRLLTMDEAEYVEYLMSKYRIEPLALDWKSLEVSQREEIMDGRRFPGDFDVQPGNRYRKQVLTYHVAFSGEAQLLRLKPNPYNAWTTDVAVLDGEVQFDLINWRDDPEQIKREADRILRNMRDQLGNVQRQVSAWSKRLRSQVAGMVRDRKAELLRQSELLQQLGVPVRTSEDIPAAFRIPIRKRAPILTEDGPRPARERSS